MLISSATLVSWFQTPRAIPHRALQLQTAADRLARASGRLHWISSGGVQGLTRAETIDGGQGGIRTRGGCYTTHAFQACALNHSATCPESDSLRQKLQRASSVAYGAKQDGRSYSAVDRLGNGIFPRPTRLARVRAAFWGIGGGGSGLGMVAAGNGRRSNRA
jgi:hypothetical protein